MIIYAADIILQAMASLLLQQDAPYIKQINKKYKVSSASSEISRALRSQDSVVGIATGYGLDDREVRVRVLVGSRIFSSPCRSDRLCGPPNFLSNGYWGSFPRGKVARA
jgi:hypothetical protein